MAPPPRIFGAVIATGALLRRRSTGAPDSGQAVSRQVRLRGMQQRPPDEVWPQRWGRGGSGDGSGARPVWHTRPQAPACMVCANQRRNVRQDSAALTAAGSETGPLRLSGWDVAALPVELGVPPGWRVGRTKGLQLGEAAPVGLHIAASRCRSRRGRRMHPLLFGVGGVLDGRRRCRCLPALPLRQCRCAFRRHRRSPEDLQAPGQILERYPAASGWRLRLAHPRGCGLLYTREAWRGCDAQGWGRRAAILAPSILHHLSRHISNFETAVTRRQRPDASHSAGCS